MKMTFAYPPPFAYVRTIALFCIVRLTFHSLLALPFSPILFPTHPNAR